MTLDSDYKQGKDVNQSVVWMVDSIRRLLSDMLTHTNKHAFGIQYATVDIQDMFDHMVRLHYGYIHKKNLHIVRDFDSITSLQLPDGYIQSCLDNLLANATKYTPENGHISIKSKIIEISDIDTHSITHKDFPYIWECVIQNTGPGIPQQQIHEIMTAQLSSRLVSGMGLLFVREFIKWMGGKFTISSEKDQGVFCTISVPCKKTYTYLDSNLNTKLDPPGARSLIVHNETMEYNDKLVLIIEDNYLQSYFLGQEIEQQDYKTKSLYKISSIDGFIQDFGQRTEKPAYIVLDGSIGCVNGVDVAIALKNSGYKGKIYMITGNTNIQQSPESFFDGVLYKPYKIQDVLKLLES